MFIGCSSYLLYAQSRVKTHTNTQAVASPAIWGTGARAPRLPTVSLLVYIRVNLRANYPSIV